MVILLPLSEATEGQHDFFFNFTSFPSEIYVKGEKAEEKEVVFVLSRDGTAEEVKPMVPILKGLGHTVIVLHNGDKTGIYADKIA